MTRLCSTAAALVSLAALAGASAVQAREGWIVLHENGYSVSSGIDGGRMCQSDLGPHQIMVFAQQRQGFDQVVKAAVASLKQGRGLERFGNDHYRALRIGAGTGEVVLIASAGADMDGNASFPTPRAQLIKLLEGNVGRLKDCGALPITTASR